MKIARDGVNILENYMLHVLDLRANYWSLWTETRNLAHYNELYPRGFERLRANMGCRLRPSWVWQRKRSATFELIVVISNRGVSGVPGVLWLKLESADEKVKLRGSIDAGEPRGGGIGEASFLLPKEYVGQLHLSAQLEIRPAVFRPVPRVCEQPQNPDGSISIDLKPLNDPGWRKGV